MEIDDRLGHQDVDIQQKRMILFLYIFCFTLLLSLLLLHVLCIFPLRVVVFCGYYFYMSFIILCVLKRIYNYL